MKESQIQKECLDYLRLKGFFAWRQNNISIRGRSFTGMRGLSDIVCLIPNKAVFIEVKQPSMRQTSEQKEFEKRVKELDHLYLLCHSLDELIDQMEVYL